MQSLSTQQAASTIHLFVKKCFLVLAASAWRAESIGDLKVLIYRSQKNRIILKIHASFLQDGSGFPSPSALP